MDADFSQHGLFPGWRGYESYFGFWLNRKRLFYRQAGAVCYGVGIALGMLDPGMAYYEALADGKGEALLLKAQQDALRMARQ